MYVSKNNCLPNAIILFKESKNNPLIDEQKAFNAKFAKYRVAIEHINKDRSYAEINMT